MAAAAEAIRIRRNINVLLLRERKAADTCTSHRTAGCPKFRSRELRALDLDQTNLTFIYVNNCSITRSIRAEAAIGVSCRDAIGTNTMTETIGVDRPVAKPVSRPRSKKPATVSASALAVHFDCSRTYVAKLEAEGVIQRQGDGFPLDQSRVAYLRYLRRERHLTRRGAGYCRRAW